MTIGVAVFDASPLIAFYQVNQLELLRNLFTRNAVPAVVANEVAPSLGVLPRWIEVHEIFGVPSTARTLDVGEQAAIALTIDLSADFVILDDLAGRLTAAGLGLTTVGSLGLLVGAKRAGLITEVRPTMDAMIGDGLFASDLVYRQILELAGEID